MAKLACVMVGATLFASHPAKADEVASFLGRSITLAELAVPEGGTPLSVARPLAHRIQGGALEWFAVVNGLKVSDLEIETLTQNQLRSNRVNDERVASYVTKLEKELESQDIDRKRRDALEAELAVIRKYDPLANAQRIARNSIPLVEWRKVHRALYDKYGGTVISNVLGGHEAAGAVAAMLRDLERRGELVIRDLEVRAEFWRQLEEFPPQAIVPPQRVDLSFFWITPDEQPPR